MIWRKNLYFKNSISDKMLGVINNQLLKEDSENSNKENQKEVEYLLKSKENEMNINLLQKTIRNLFLSSIKYMLI